MFQLMKNVMNLNQTISLRTTLKNNSLINSPGIVLKPNKHVMDIFYGQRSHGYIKFGCLKSFIPTSTYQVFAKLLAQSKVQCCTIEDHQDLIYVVNWHLSRRADKCQKCYYAVFQLKANRL